MIVFEQINELVNLEPTKFSSKPPEDQGLTIFYANRHWQTEQPQDAIAWYKSPNKNAVSDLQLQAFLQESIAQHNWEYDVGRHLDQNRQPYYLATIHDVPGLISQGDSEMTALLGVYLMAVKTLLIPLEGQPI